MPAPTLPTVGAALALSRLSPRGRIVNPDGSPTTYFYDFMDKTLSTLEAQDAANREVLEGVIDVLEFVLRVLAGEETFTGIDVNGKRSEDFFGKLDATGAKLSDPTGLDTAVVETAAVSDRAVTERVSSYSETTIARTADANVLLGSASITPSGGSIDVMFYAATLFPASRSTVVLEMRRDGAEIATTRASFDGEDIVPMTVLFQDATVTAGVTYDYEVYKLSGEAGFYERGLFLTEGKDDR